MKKTDTPKVNVLVTGATGYIGGKMAAHLDRIGYRVFAMTRGRQPVAGMNTVFGDLCDAQSLAQACKGMDMVCHFAGTMGRGLTDEMIREVNITGVAKMVQEAAASGVKYFVHVSSGAVVGPRGPQPADEDTVCRPYTIYEKTKYVGELTALSVAGRVGLPLSVVRPTFTYGPGDPHKLLMFRMIQKGLFFYMGDGRSTNHPVYIDDLLQGITRVMAQKPIQEVFILGGPRPVTKKEWAVAIAREAGVRPPFLHLPTGLFWALAGLMEGVGNRLGVTVPITRSRVMAMSRYWGMEIGKARQRLDYRPEIDLSEGVARTVAWYRKAGWL